jgi:aminomethyltransferase
MHLTSTRHGPLHNAHESAGAKFGDFAGWLMPLEFAGGGVLAEHTAVREAVGLFDVSHMGTFVVTGDDAIAGLNEVLTNDLNRISPGQAQYSLLCNDKGGVIDDLFVYVVNEQHVVVVPNAANAGTVIATVERVLESGGSKVADRCAQTAIIAVQGPRSAEVMDAVGLANNLSYLQFEQRHTDRGDVLIARTGYTGERGYELLVPTEEAEDWWGQLQSAVVDRGGSVCGLGARDTLRTEMGYPLHGQDLSLDINPVEAGLSWAIGWNKPAFPGLAALRRIRQEGPESRIMGIKFVDRGVPRPGMVVKASPEAEAILGCTTSGTFSPTLKQGIALALLDSDVRVGDEVFVDVRGRQCHAVVDKIPFVPARVRD